MSESAPIPGCPPATDRWTMNCIYCRKPSIPRSKPALPLRAATIVSTFSRSSPCFYEACVNTPIPAPRRPGPLQSGKCGKSQPICVSGMRSKSNLPRGWAGVSPAPVNRLNLGTFRELPASGPPSVYGKAVEEVPTAPWPLNPAPCSVRQKLCRCSSEQSTHSQLTANEFQPSTHPQGD